VCVRARARARSSGGARREAWRVLGRLAGRMRPGKSPTSVNRGSANRQRKKATLERAIAVQEASHELREHDNAIAPVQYYPRCAHPGWLRTPFTARAPRRDSSRNVDASYANWRAQLA
jgi:hypothetical protein